MKVCVAVPCYNGAAYIAKCVQALLEQTWQADEVLVIDDGSTDGSAEQIRGYPVRLVKHTQNQGLSAARNTALQQANCEIIVYVDVDAYAHPEMLSCLLPPFQEHGVTGAGGQGIESVQKTIYDRWRSFHASQGHGHETLRQVEHLFGLCMAYRREALLEIGGFDTRLRTNAEDMDIGYRLTDAGKRLVYNPEAKVFHQRQDDHASLRRMMHQWYYWAFIIKAKNGRNPWTLAFGTLRRLFWSDTIPDLFMRRSLELARLDVEMAGVKLGAIAAASRSHQRYMLSKDRE